MPIDFETKNNERTQMIIRFTKMELNDLHFWQGVIETLIENYVHIYKNVEGEE